MLSRYSLTPRWKTLKLLTWFLDRCRWLASCQTFPQKLQLRRHGSSQRWDFLGCGRFGGIFLLRRILVGEFPTLTESWRNETWKMMEIPRSLESPVSFWVPFLGSIVKFLRGVVVQLEMSWDQLWYKFNLDRRGLSWCLFIQIIFF